VDIVIETIILVTGLILSFFMAVSLGGNDAAEPTDAAVGAGVISIKKAVILFALFTAVGAMTQGFMVMKTIGKGIVPEISIAGAFASVTAAVLWVNLIASKLGIDVSVTHSITGAVFGYGLVAYGFSLVNSNIIYLIILSWISSPFASLFLAYILYKMIVAIIRGFNINVFEERVEKILSYLLILGLIFSAFAFGTNDIANATGVYVTVAEKLGRMPDYNAMLMLAAFGSLGIAVGGYFIGPRVITTMAYKITRLDILTGLAAELSNALVVYLFTTIPYMLIGFGLPISTSLASAGSLIGVGLAAGGRSNVDKKTVTTLATFWVLTVPVTMIISGSIYYLLHVVLGIQ
jgi:PiT family inorganic phosphate transporter